MTRLSPARVVAVFALLTLLPLVLLAGLTERMAGRAVRKDVRAHIATTSSVSAGFVEQHLQGLADVVNSYAGRPRLLDAVAARDDASITSTLQELLRARSGIPGVFVSDLSGHLTHVVPPTPDIVGRDFSFRDWYQGLQHGDGPYVSEAYKTAIAGNSLVVAAAAYIHGADGRPVAIIGATYELATIQELTDQLARAQHLDLEVTDQRGVILAAPGRAATTGLVSQRSDPTVRAAIAGHSGIVTRDETGGEVVRAYAPVPNLGWTVSASVPTSRAFADVGRLKTAVRTLASVLAVVLAAGLAFLYVILQRLQRREHEVEGARDQALEVSKLKSDFLATMSHEIRTPMNGVIGMLSLLLDGELTAEQRDFARTAQTSAEALLDVINDILDFSKIEAGKLDVEVLDVDLRSLVDDTTYALGGRAQDKGVELVVDMPPGSPVWVRTDPGRLRQILTNLLGNAVKFTSEGEVVLRVATVAEDAETATIRFDVRDTGVGIPLYAQARLFEAFTQADASTTRQYGGTGLGLAISSRLVELLGGQLTVTSEPGTGSTFSFTLALATADSPPLSATPAPFDLRGMHTLVVDDNPTNRLVLERFLQSWSMHPEVASGGVEAIDLAQQASSGGEPFTLALLDFNMPHMDGIELARSLRADPASAPRWVVLLTSSGERGEARRAREAGVDAYLTKPVRQSQLFDCLAELVAPRAPQEAPAARADIGQGALVLIAEDNEVNQQVATRMVESLGFRTHVVGNGAEAVDAVLTGDYAVVLMDGQMPVMDGFRATEEIRRREGRVRHTPVIALTAGAMKGDAERCIAAGMDDYLSKPILRPVLQQKLLEWVPAAAPSTVQADGAADPSGDGDAFDQAILADLRAMGSPDDDLVGELLTLFLSQLDTRLAALADAVEAHDDNEIRAIAHNLRGSSANLGATSFARVAARMEAAAENGDDRDAMDTLLAHLRHEEARVREAVRVELGS